MDEQTKAILGSIGGAVQLNGTIKRPYAKLSGLLVKLTHWLSTKRPSEGSKTIEKIFFRFESVVLELSVEEDVYTPHRMYLRTLHEIPREELDECLDLIANPEFAHLAGLDLSSTLWQLRVGYSDVQVVFGFNEHEKLLPLSPLASITIEEDDFKLQLYKGAPTVPRLIFDVASIRLKPTGNE